MLLIGITLAADADPSQKKAGEPKSCKALALSGGGSKGSYEAGVLYGLVMNDQDKTKYEYDVVTGVSAGAINLGAIASFDKGQESALVQFLSDTWAGINDQNVYKNWSPLGLVTGLLYKSGVFDDTPLTNFINSIFQQFSYTIYRKIVVSCVDAVNGDYVTYNETSKDITKAIVSSASIPFVFPYQTWPNDVVCIDGGVVWNTNLASAIDRCMEVVDDHSQITMDIVICSDYTQSVQEDQNWNAVSNVMRQMEIKDNYQGLQDVYELMQAHPNVTYRYFVMPSRALAGSLNMLNFDNTTNTWPMQMTGRLDGENALKDGEGFMYNKMKLYRQSPILQSMFPTVNHFTHSIIKMQAKKYRMQRRQEMNTTAAEDYHPLEEYEKALWVD